MRFVNYGIFSIGVTVLLLISCKGEHMGFSSKIQNDKRNNDIILKLKRTKIYFGHQSVGFEIIQGIEDLQKKITDLNLRITESKNQSDYRNFTFLHSRNGRNCDPKSKINAFKDTVNAGIGNKADFAFFKFCFVDVDENTNIQEMFDYYRIVMQALEKNFQKTKFIHMTMPLVSEKLPLLTWMKNIVKKFTGHYIVSSELNIKRTQFNELMRAEYQGKGSLFDLAMIESTRPDGKVELYQKKHGTYCSMYYGYTYDGGHLNESGRDLMAEELLLYLANKTD